MTVAMSVTIGGCSPAGIAKLIGEAPVAVAIVPAGSCRNRWHDTANPIQSASRASREYLPALPKWKWFRLVAAPIPIAFAFWTAAAAAWYAPKCPIPPSPS